MISYTLKCAKDHEFQSWFASADGYERLRAAGHVACPVCGDGDVAKALMAPRVTAARDKAGDKPSLRAPAAEQDVAGEAALARMKAKIEAESEYVGRDFATEARAIHDGDAPHRSIWGEAKIGDAKRLHDDGVTVMPLPFIPTRKTS